MLMSAWFILRLEIVIAEEPCQLDPCFIYEQLVAPLLMVCGFAVDGVSELPRYLVLPRWLNRKSTTHRHTSRQHRHIITCTHKK